MVNAAGAEALRNRARRGTVAQQRAYASALGYSVTERDLAPAKNKQFPYYSRARERDCFRLRRRRRRPGGDEGSGAAPWLDAKKAVTKYHRRNDVQEAIDRSGVKRTLVIERPLSPAERRQAEREVRDRRAERRRQKSAAASHSVASSANSSPFSTLSSNASSTASATSARWIGLHLWSTCRSWETELTQVLTHQSVQGSRYLQHTQWAKGFFKRSLPMSYLATTL